MKYVEQHDKQKECTEAFKSGKNIIVLFWGNRVGKTEWGGQTVAREVLEENNYEVWSFCPSFDEQKDTTQKKLLNYIPEHRIKDRVWLRKGILKEIILDNGSKITFKSYEQGREKAQGAGKRLIWFDEEPPKDIWEECFVRQEAGTQLKIILTMTAIKGMTWVYNDIYLKTNNPDLFISKAGWDDNPWLLEEQKQAMSRGLSEQVLKVRRNGEFVKMVGLVCSWFDRTKHIVDINKLPLGDTYFAIDFGFSNPSCGLWVRIDRQDNYWVFDGFYRKEMTNPKLQEIIRMKEQGILGIIHRVGDSAQAGDIRQLNDYGIEITGIKKIVGESKESWDEYRARLMEERGVIQESTNKPKLFISSSLVDIDDNGDEFNFLMRELENLRWEEIKTDMGIESKPIWGKQPKHAIDALSYILTSIKRSTVMDYNYTPQPVKPFYPELGI